MFTQNVAKLMAVFDADTKGLQNGVNSANQEVKGATNNMGLLGKAAKSAAVAGLAVAAAKGAQMAYEFGKAGAQINRLETSFAQLASASGESSDEILSSLQRASSGTVDQASLILSANRAIMLGLGADAEKMGDLMEVARFRGRAMGLTTQQAFNDIVTGVGRMSPMILDNLGIVVDSEAAYIEYATALGTTASELSEVQKKQALLNTVLETGKKQINDAGGLADDSADAYEHFEASIKTLGSSITKVGDEAGAISVAVDGLADGVDWVNDRTLIWIDNLKNARTIIDHFFPAVGGQQSGGGGSGGFGGGTGGIAYVPGKGNRGLDEGWGASGYIGPTVGPAAYIKDFGSEIDDATASVKSFGSGLSAISSGMSSIKGLMSPTSATRLDFLETKHGEYKDKWDEPRRRVEDVIQRGSASPWAQQYFGGLQGEMLEMRALQWGQKWDMGLYDQLGLSQADRDTMQSGLGTAWWNQESGNAQQTQLAGDVYGQYGGDIGAAFGTVWDDTVKELAIGQPVLEKLVSDLEADSEMLKTAGGKLWTQIMFGIDGADVNALELLLNSMAPGMADWLMVNGYLNNN